jgi:hypothetical protein
MIFWLVCKGTGHFWPEALAGFTTFAYPVDSGGAIDSILSDRIRSVAGTTIDGQGALVFSIPEGIFRPSGVRGVLV